MDTVFPFGLRGATAWYETLYVLTFALHQALMHYVLAGSLVVAWATLLPGPGPLPRSHQPIAALLRDWMPFLLSAAITAGVAPLLFIQILYPQQFYTANLLLSWRWMIVIPVLIVVFYLLYVLKTDLVANRSWAAQAAVALAVAAGMVFVGFCWTANYLLSIDQAQWPEVFVTGLMPFGAGHVILRMLMWISGSLVSMSVIVGWQLGQSADSRSARQLGSVALVGLSVFSLTGAAALWWAGEALNQLIWSIVGGPYLALLAIGLLLLLASWILEWKNQRLTRLLLMVATAGWVLSLVAVSALRELGRMAAVDVAALAPEHAEATRVGGLSVFLVFAVINGAAIAWCVWIARQSTKQGRTA